MTIIPYGLRTVTTSGTPVPVGAGADLGAVAQIVVTPKATNIATVYVGSSAITIATGAGVYTVMLKPASGYTDRIVIPIDMQDSGNTIDPTAVYLDADTSGDKCYAFGIRN